MIDAGKLARRIETLLGNKQAREAVPLCEDLNRQAPDFARGWYLTSQVAMQLGNPRMSEVAIRRATDLEPGTPAWQLQLGLCLAAQSRMQELINVLEPITTDALKTAYQLSTFASLLCQVNRHEDALPAYKTALVLEPGNHHHAYNIACLCRSLGKLGEAESFFDKAIELSGGDAESYKLRSDLRTQSADDNHVTQLRTRLGEANTTPRDRVQLLFGLAKELEDLGEYKDSFEALKTGVDIRRSLMKYDVNNDLQTIEAIQQNFTSEVFDTKSNGSASEEPIFILGMPRTGTTLVERILSSHSDVHSAGELTNFTVQMMNQVSQGERPKNRETLVAATTRLNFEQLGADYIESTRPFTGHTPRFIDKLPLNYLYVGLIHLALPNAKIIVLNRHPVDTCYSVYKQLFMDAYPFSYDLSELAQYYIAYSSLMDHWQAVLPGVIHVMDYENLTADVEGETRRLLDYCDLPFELGCLDFTANKQPSTTASAAQVRQPVYGSSVGKWKHYEEQLQTLITGLEAAGISCR
jgi:tetratricopeptide (TPR) repeat protein